MRDGSEGQYEQNKTKDDKRTIPLSWAEQLSQMTKEEREKERMKHQIAFNNSPEAAEIDKQFLDMLKRGQQEEKAIHESQISLKDDKSSQFLQDQKAFSESPEARQIVDEVIEALAQENLRDRAIRKRHGLK